MGTRETPKPSAAAGQDGPSAGPSKGPNCWECRYLSITWDPRMPYGCKMMGFRSRVIPSLEVLRTDGRFCGGFSPKPHASSKPEKSVDKPSNRRQTDLSKPFHPINLIT